MYRTWQLGGQGLHATGILLIQRNCPSKKIVAVSKTARPQRRETDRVLLPQ